MKRKTNVQTSIHATFLESSLYFKISPWFLSEYLNLELEWRLNLPLRRNFRHSSKWQLEKCSWMNACFLDQKLTSKRCVEIRLLHALKKLILTIMELIILQNVEILFWNFKSMPHLEKPENHHKQKINKIFAPVFTGKILWVISKYKYKT